METNGHDKLAAMLALTDEQKTAVEAFQEAYNRVRELGVDFIASQGNDGQVYAFNAQGTEWGYDGKKAGDENQIDFDEVAEPLLMWIDCWNFDDFAFYYEEFR